MSKDTIYREDAMALVNKPVCPTGNSDYDEGKENEREAIKESLIALPSADRPQGKWLLKDNVFHCGCCGKESHFTADDVYVYDMPLPDFCEKCGARLKGADDD